MRTILLASIVGFVLLAAPASAQRTGDHIVPSIETVCDDDPFSFGLCNAYCEALDCHCPTPGTEECTALGTPRACSNLLKNYKKKSGGLAPPCGCPCGFNVEADFATLVATGNLEFDFPLDVAGTFTDQCGAFGPNSENAYLAEAETAPTGGATPQEVRLFYWIEAATAEDPATCNEVGGGIDDHDAPLIIDFDYSPEWVGPVQEELDASELGACQAILDFLCAI